MKLEWRELEEFPNYVVSNTGEFANMRTDREVRPSMNQLGHLKVTLHNQGRMYTRAVAPIVAKAFIPEERAEFNTPIHLDGDLRNCRVDNLMWRPRWFAIRYHKQFMWEAFHNHDIEIVEINSGRLYPSVKAACIENGLYYHDVVKSFWENTFVFPTWQEFSRI